MQLKRNIDVNRNIQGHLFALAANILWGLMTFIGKSILAEFSALSVTTFRVMDAAACFWSLSLFCRREQVNHRDMLKISFTTSFALILNQGVYIFGLSMTSSVDVSTVTITLPVVVVIVATIYLKEPVANKKVLDIFVGAIGVLILIMNSQNTGSGGGSTIGDLLRLIAQISFSIYLTIFKGLSQKYPPITPNKWMFTYASMCYILFPYHGIAVIQWARVLTVALVQVGYIVVGDSFSAHICVMTAQRLLCLAVVDMYNYMQPIVASIITVAIGMVTLDLGEGIAIALMSLGVYIVTQSKSHRDFEKEGKRV